MFDSLVAAALGSRGVSSVGAWARVENAACAQRLFACADELERMLAADGSDNRDQWCLDNWGAVAASIAAAQQVSLGVASHQLLIADALRRRLPRVAEVFAAGAISYRLVSAVVARTRLITDREAMAKVDIEIAARVQAWGTLSADKTATEIDYWVDRYDPAAVRRTEFSVRDCHVDVRDPEDGSGTAWVEGKLVITDADALDQRLDAMARGVCEGDPRTHEQRRAAALGALGHGVDRLVCGCENPDCAAAATQPSAVVVHVITHEESLSDDTPAQLDGADPPHPVDKPLGEMTIREALTPTPWTPVLAVTPPAFVLGRGMLPAPLLAAKIAGTAKIVPIRHPGNTAPEPRYIPSAVLATFIRCRDMTCRFPGCDEPAQRCDLDHTIAYPAGPTQASNLKCLCRQHHLLKTFWGWRDEQHPDGTVVWTCPQGQTYTTYPGSRLLFPTLCRPTAPVTVRVTPDPDTTNRTLAMPRRTTTRAHNRSQAINDERRHNEHTIQTEAEAHRQKQRENAENNWEDAYFPFHPRPPSGDDPPPF
ncbi:HNH endonuclease signature motif containing protein [Mycolicibacterium rhodesiae]|uniref:HNH endonuclease signature motif containing protein n=1 Tax=Mycolicibacterium rhodesiae TaxID=36814 RepID=UPI0002ED66EE|nr:HNH endonuclease signature motif containing protein [Mycolicibacterium rhodesiae]